MAEIRHSGMPERHTGGNPLPEGWTTTELGKVVEYGRTQKVELKDVDHSTWVLELEDIEKGTSKLLQRLNASERAFKSTKNKFEAGDVLYGKLRPYLNKVIIADDAGVCTTEIIPLNAEPAVSNRYLFHWLKGKDFLEYVNEVSYGVNMPRLGTKDGVAAPLVLPPLAEQKVIAEKLDTLLAQVDTTKARLERIPDIIKRFRQSVLAAAVSGKLTEEWRALNPLCCLTSSKLLANHREKWEQSKLEEFLIKKKVPKTDSWKKKYKKPEVLELHKKWDTPSSWAWTTIDTIATVTKLAGFEFTKVVEYSDNGSVPVIKAENIGKEGYKKTNYSFVTPDIVRQLPRSELFGDEMLVTFVGAGVGQVGRVPKDRKYFLGPNVAVIKNISMLYDAAFMEFLLRSNEGKRNLLGFSKGAAQPSLSMGQIRQVTVPMPPTQEQTEIVRRVEELFAFADSIEQKAVAALERVNNLTQSILAKAFRGELTADWRAANPELISGDNSAEALLAKIQAEREALKPVKKTRKKKAKA